MKRRQNLERGDASASAVDEGTQAGGAAGRARNRRRAVTYLAAAVGEKDACERKDLRRRAAELILSAARRCNVSAR